MRWLRIYVLNSGSDKERDREYMCEGRWCQKTSLRWCLPDAILEMYQSHRLWVMFKIACCRILVTAATKTTIVMNVISNCVLIVSLLLFMQIIRLHCHLRLFACLMILFSWFWMTSFGKVIFIAFTQKKKHLQL